MSSELPINDRSMKRRYLWTGIGIWGPVFWAGMNIFMFMRHQEPRLWHDLIVWLLVTFAGSECLGVLVGIGMWVQARRTHGFHKP